MSETEEVLRAKAAAIWDVQESMLRLYCRLNRAADEAGRERRMSDDGKRALREARRWLGRGVVEVVG